MRSPLLLSIAVLLGGCAAFQATEPLPLEGFSDGIKHWRSLHGDQYAKYQPQQVREIANNILLYQRNNGSWIENRDPTRVLNSEEKAALLKDKQNETGSFDNRNIYTQVEYLAGAYERTGEERYRAGSMKGLEYIFAQQIGICGGWPHTVPGKQTYHPYITMADEVTSGVLYTLRKIAARETPFTFIDSDVAERAAAAVVRGDECLLRLQIVQNGELTGWGGQYDPKTLQPAQGRSFELPSIVSQESVANLRYLMSIPNPSPSVVRAIESGVAWLERSKIHGKRVETFNIPPIKYQYHTATTDRRIIDDPKAPPMWARFHDLNDNSPVLANRDSKRVARYEDIAHERRTGYAWFGTWPAKLLTVDYPAWKARMAKPAPATQSDAFAD